MLAVVFCMLLTWPSCSTTRHTMRCLYGRCRYGPRLSKRSNGMSVGCVGGEARGEIVGLRRAWQQSGRAGIMRMAGVEAWTRRRGRGGGDVVALAWTPAAVVRCRSRFAWCGARTRALAHGGGRSTASSLRSGIPLADVLAPPGCARTLRRRARHVGRPSREGRGVRVPRRIRSRSLGIPVLAAGARTAWSLAMARRITTRARQRPKRFAAWSGPACSRAERP